jgi:plasmid stabilization system protein ParE
MAGGFRFSRRAERDLRDIGDCGILIVRILHERMLAHGRSGQRNG